MAIETIGKFQLHLIAYQLPENDQWAPYLMVHRFDEGSDRFECIVERRRVMGDTVFPTYEDAIEAARRAGKALIESGTL